MDPFLGEIRMFGGNFAPKNWAVCDGQLLSISQNTALYSLFGTIYGGDGRTTFGLPDLRGSSPMFWGSGLGLSTYTIGEKAGTPTVTLTSAQLPAHQHLLSGGEVSDFGPPPVPTAANNLPGGDGGGINNFFSSVPTPRVPMGLSALTGGTQAHNNMMPYLCVIFIVALQGVYPPRP